MTTTFRLSACRECDAYFDVFISSTETEFREFVRVRYDYDNANMTGACIRDYAPEDRSCLGAVCLARELLGVGYVCHELAHACFRICEAHSIQVRHWMVREHDEGVDNEHYVEEEQYCTILEYLNAGFWREVYARGLAQEAESRPEETINGIARGEAVLD